MAALATLAFAASAAEKAPAKPKWTGTIPVQGKLPQARLKQMAKITAPEATRTALAAVPGNAADKTVKETELEVEHGFLIYCVDVQIKGEKGSREVIVDAGSG